MQKRGPMLTGRLAFVMVGAALLATALIVSGAIAAKRKAVEVTNSVTVQGQSNTDGPFDSASVTSTCRSARSRREPPPRPARAA